MRRTIIHTFLICLTGFFFTASIFADENSGSSPKSILKQDFPDSKYWPMRGNRLSIEFCGGDWCQEVIGKNSIKAEAAWDAIFLMFYFYDANDEFRARRKTIAINVIDRRAESCEGNFDARAACALGKIQTLYGFKYRRVQYDIGFRCSSVFSVKPPHFSSHGRCVRLEQ